MRSNTRTTRASSIVDLKPANIKITPEGRVKILDFGLAKAFRKGSDGSNDGAPTMTIDADTSGVILGTAAYMEPEQVRGGEADNRADIWSFGVVVYKMLTGRRLFTGETMSDILAAVLEHEPDWNSVSAPVRRLVRACLV